jgi:hypothetical protein
MPNGRHQPEQAMQQTTLASSAQAADPREIVSGRVIDAPRQKVFKAFADEDGKTRIGWRMLFESAEVRDRIATFAVAANEENFDRLQAELATVN